MVLGTSGQTGHSYYLQQFECLWKGLPALLDLWQLVIIAERIANVIVPEVCECRSQIPISKYTATAKRTNDNNEFRSERT
jgi:hypothetical protein